MIIGFASQNKSLFNTKYPLKVALINYVLIK